MTQLTINIEDASIIPHLKKILNAIEGVSVAKATKSASRPGIERAYDDVAAGRTTHYATPDDLFKAFGI